MPIAITTTPIMNTIKNFTILSDIILNQRKNLFTK
jgi:hypothetical protein